MAQVARSGSAEQVASSVRFEPVRVAEVVGQSLPLGLGELPAAAQLPDALHDLDYGRGGGQHGTHMLLQGQGLRVSFTHDHLDGVVVLEGRATRFIRLLPAHLRAPHRAPATPGILHHAPTSGAG